jgi:DNA polymerase III sliding clamp (beta) subunit (PCNA family)
MNKSQVKALLDIISTDEIRPVLTYALIDEFEDRLMLVATDGYALAAIVLANADKELCALYKGKLISRQSLTRWYKLASAKDILSTEELLSMAESIEAMHYPQWQPLVKSHKPESTTCIAFNAQYAVMLAKIAGSNLTYTLQGNTGSMLARQHDSSYLLMPLRQ